MNIASGDGTSLSKAWPLGNEAFLRAVFGDRWEDAHVCPVTGDPTRANPGDWAGGKAKSWLRHLTPRTNNYFAVSTFRGDRRVESAFEALWVLGIDDVGPKINAQTVLNLLGEPTYRIETSPGNEHWGYRLAVPITHVGRAKALQRAVRVALTGVDGRDPGQEHVTRYMRLPVGMNWKGSGSQVRQAHWSARLIPEAEIELWCEQLGVPGPDDPSWDTVAGGKLHRLAASSPGGPGQIDEDDYLLRAMRELDLVLGQPRAASMGLGVDVRCPWSHEHTGGPDTGAFYKPGGKRGFRCHHGHCQERHVPQLAERLNEMLKEDSGGLVCLGARDFDEVNPATVPLVHVAPPAKLKLDGKTYDMTEDGLALAFIDKHGGRMRYDHTRKAWVLWEKGPPRWLLDGVECAFSWARDLARELRAQNQTREAMVLGKISAAAAIERAARADPRVRTTILSWDRDPVAVAAAGVHVDLRTGASRPLEPRDLILRSTSVRPDPGMPTPLWDRFMQETFGGDIDLIEFVHAWFGYSLTADMSAEKLVFMYGTGGNGKGVLVHTMSQIAGGYSIPVGSDLITERKFQGHPTELARLCGARMAFATEVDDDARWNLKMLKMLTGNEGTLHGRFMRQDFFEFKPTTKLTIVGNHKPAIGHVDDAIARRLLLVPFLAKPVKPDPSLKARLEGEYPGILAQMIEGAGRVLAALAPGGIGFTALVPQSVVDASRAYLVGQDVLALWLSERCAAGSGAGVLRSQAYGDYETWCAAEGFAVSVGPRKFSDEVQRAAGIAGMPIRIEHRKKGSTLIGVYLKPLVTQ